MPLIAKNIIIKGQGEKLPDPPKKEIEPSGNYHVLKDGELVHKYNKKSDYLKDMTDFK